LSHRVDCCGEFHYAYDGGDDDDDGGGGAYVNQTPKVTTIDHGDASAVSRRHHLHHCTSGVASSIYDTSL